MRSLTLRINEISRKTWWFCTKFSSEPVADKPYCDALLNMKLLCIAGDKAQFDGKRVNSKHMKITKKTETL